MPSDPFAVVCSLSRLMVPLEPLAESVPMPETPQITTEIGLTYGEFQGIANKEDPGSDPGINRWTWGVNVFGDQDDFLQWLEGK